jgi:hypothetical protein
MLPRANSALRRTVHGGFFGVGRQAVFGIQRLEEPDGVEMRIVEQRGRGPTSAGCGRSAQRMKPSLARYGSRPRRRVEHGAVGMLDQHEPCHGFEHRDLYFLTFAASFPVGQRHRRGVEGQAGDLVRDDGAGVVTIRRSR